MPPLLRSFPLIPILDKIDDPEEYSILFVANIFKNIKIISGKKKDNIILFLTICFFEFVGKYLSDIDKSFFKYDKIRINIK